MRKQILALLLVLVASLALSLPSVAQTRIGGGLVYGTEIENPGINAHGEIFLNEQWAIAPGIVYFFPKKIVEDLDFKWFEINANAHYYFEADGVEPYALGGLNIAMVSVDFPNFFTGEVESETSTEVGLNIGGGVNFNTGGNLKPFGELRYVIGDADQLVIGAGIRFALN